MARTAFIRARTEPALKHRAESILANLGLNPTTVVNVLYQQIVKRKAVPFTIGEPNETTVKAMREARSGQGVRRFDSANALFADLKK